MTFDDPRNLLTIHICCATIRREKIHFFKLGPLCFGEISSSIIFHFEVAYVKVHVRSSNFFNLGHSAFERCLNPFGPKYT
jgi:hypothetical protein